MTNIHSKDCDAPNLLSQVKMLSVLVTGANRGIGLGFVREFLNEPTVVIVIATVRNLEKAKELTNIGNDKLRVVICDVSDEASIATAAEKVREIVDGKGVDILINNAGIYPSSRGLGVTKSDVMRQFEVNAVGPLLVANKFHDLLKKAAELHGSAQIVNISTGCCSLELAINDSLPPTAYAMCKAALNMLTRKLALEWKGDKIRATAFAPGWVQTDMGGPGAELTVEESTSAITKLIFSLTEDHNGGFYRHNGAKVPW